MGCAGGINRTSEDTLSGCDMYLYTDEIEVGVERSVLSKCYEAETKLACQIHNGFFYIN